MSQIAIKVDNVYKEFKLPHERTTSIKSMFVNLFKLKGKRTYERQRVLKDITFDIKEGEFFGIVGRNGSGKSTLLKLLAGVYSPDKGAIHINGKLTPFIELGVGFNPELTGRENIFLNGALLGFNRKEMNARYDEIVEFAELEKFMDQKLKNYSSGMQVRLAFSIAIQAKSDILLLDEVLAVGDAAFQQKCYDYFERLKREKKTVVFVSHDMSAVNRFCTQAIYIKEGQIVFRGSPREVSDIYAEENLAKDIKQESNNNDSLSPLIKVKSKIKEKNDKLLMLQITYESKQEDDMYVGISLQKDGISIAEITTSLDKPLKGRGEVTYALDTSIYNGGSYRVGVGLFLLETRRLLAASNNSNAFTIKGNDITRGAAIKLADTWNYKN